MRRTGFVDSWSAVTALSLVLAACGTLRPQSGAPSAGATGGPSSGPPAVVATALPPDDAVPVAQPTLLPAAAGSAIGCSAPDVRDLTRLARILPPSDTHRRLDVAANQIAAGRTAEARAALERMMGEVERDAQVDELSVAHALLGRIHQRAGALRQALAEYEIVIGLWRDPQSNAERIGQPGEGDDVRAVRLALGVDALGEALFFQGEQARARADAIAFPTYRGAPYRPPARRLEDMTQQEFEAEMARRKTESDALKRHIDTRVKDWVDRKRQAIEEAEGAYLRVAKIKPVAPMRWVVQGAARTGQMWSGFVADFRRTPAPAWLAADPELNAVYTRGLEAASEAMLDRARGAFRTCVTLAERHQLAGEHGRTCREWLAAHPEQ